MAGPLLTGRPPAIACRRSGCGMSFRSFRSSESDDVYPGDRVRARGQHPPAVVGIQLWVVKSQKLQRLLTLPAGTGAHLPPKHLSSPRHPLDAAGPNLEPPCLGASPPNSAPPDTTIRRRPFVVWQRGRPPLLGRALVPRVAPDPSRIFGIRKRRRDELPLPPCMCGRKQLEIYASHMLLYTLSEVHARRFLLCSAQAHAPMICQGPQDRSRQSKHEHAATASTEVNTVKRPIVCLGLLFSCPTLQVTRMHAPGRQASQTPERFGVPQPCQWTHNRAMRTPVSLCRPG
mmetsp:Transcript_148501/g.259549  ORF Transcript_148501/g.259549 Transcript_148501/m.259549 type:complete len:288 (-) Transcript_148501:276-1139(-)